jgi:hypothetical protein
MEGIPWILQYNKRDMPQVSSLDEMNASLNNGHVPVVEAVAVNGTGVKDTLKGISSLVIKKLNADSTGGPPKEERKASVVAVGSQPAKAPVPAAPDEDFEELTDDEKEALETGSEAPKGRQPKLPEPKTAPAAPKQPAAKATAPAPKAAPAAAAPKAAPAPAAPTTPTLQVVAQNKALLRGMGLGSANLTLANMVGGDSNQYQLTGKVSFLGIFGSTWSRTLRFSGSESRTVDGAEARFHRFASDDNATPPLSVLVKDDHEKHLYVTYVGSFGEVQIVPPGKKPLA